MPTSKPRVTITLDEQLHDSIIDYQHSNKCKNRTAVINELIEQGLRAKSPEGENARAINAGPTTLEEFKNYVCLAIDEHLQIGKGVKSTHRWRGLEVTIK